MANKFSTGPAFTTHVPVHPFGTDPSQTVKALGQPAPLRRTVTKSWINRGDGSGLVGKMAGAATPASASITCTQANVTPGYHVIRIGGFELRPAVDFLVGGSDAALATNLAAAIDGLPGFSSPVPAAAVVSINTSTGHGDDHVMEVVEWGPASAFALTALDQSGVMDRGAPAPAAPLFG